MRTLPIFMDQPEKPKKKADGSLPGYFDQVAVSPRLAEREKRQLIQLAQRGDASAVDILLRAHLRFILHKSKRFYRSGMFLEMEDLIQQGCIGLLRAIQKFDLKRTARGKAVHFITYAPYWIEHAIRREIANRGRTIAVPQHIHSEIRSLRDHLSGAEGRQLRSIPARAAERRASPRSLENVLALLVETVPLEESSEDPEGLSRADRVSEPSYDGPEHTAHARQEKERVRKMLQKLPERESYIIDQNFGLSDGKPKTLAEISRTLGVDPEWVRQL